MAGGGSVELGVGYISIVPSSKGFTNELNKQIGQATAGVSKVGENAGSRVAAGMGKALKVGGVAAGAVLATSLTAGFKRLTAIEDAEAKLKGLGNSAADTTKIMDNALAAVKGTAFGMDEAATTAASAVAAGLKPGKELQGYLSLVGDTATIAGTSMADMGGIFNKVMTSGKVQGDVFAQLGDQGIPVVQMLSDTLGVSAEEVYKLGSAGKITSDQFLEAMSSMEGAALAGGNTTTGAFKNLGAAMSRLGAGLLGGMFPHFKTAFTELTSWVDGLESTLTPVADAIGQKLGSAFEAVVGWMKQLDFSSWSNFTSSLGSSGGVFDSIKNSMVELQPAFTAMRDALPAIGSAAVKLGSGALQILAGVLGFLARNVDTIIKWMPALLAGYAAWRVTSTALVASQVRLQLAQTMMAPVFLASNLLRWQAVRGEAALAAAKGTSTTATVTNTAAENGNVLTRARAALAMVGQRIAMVATTVATWAATAATTALGVALKIAMGPIGWIIAGVAALVAGLVYFFTQTETGKAVWDSLVQAFATGWEWVKNAFATAWAFIQPILSGIWTGIQYIGLIFGTVLLGSALIAWNVFSAAIQYVWNSIIKPVWDAFAAVMTWLWNTVVMPIWNAMKVGLQLLGVAFQWVWNSVIKPAWDALGAGIAFVWNTVIRPVWDALKVALGAVGTFFQWVWNSIIKPAWDALGAGIRWVADNVIQPVFDGIQRGLDLVRSAFRTAVDIIGSVWNEMREKTAAPIRFVIDTVYNKGIVAVWNKVAGWLGMDDKKLEPMALAFKSGGVLPGYTPGRDVHKFVNPATGQGLHLSGGEAIMRPEWTRAVGGAAEVDRQNRLARSGKMVERHGREAAAFAGGGVMRFASGGVIDAMMNIVQQKYPMLQMSSGLRAGDGGFHGRGLATDWSNGSGNTPAQLALAHDIAETYPGSAQLIYDSPGWAGNIANGANVGPFGGYYNLAEAGPHHHHVHWAMTTPPTMPFGGGVFEGGSDGSGGGGISIIGSMVRKAMDTIMDPIMDSIPEGQGLIGGMGRGLGDKVYGTFKDWVLSKLPSGGGSSANGDWVGNPGVEQFRGLVEKLLKEKGQPTSLVGSVLRRMNQESSGNPNAINLTDSNAMAGIPSKGLMQTIDPTFQAHKDPGYDDIWDPESNIRASMNYALATYGGLAAAYDRAGGYDSGGVLQPGTTLAINETGKPEAILTNPQWGLITNLVMTTAELLDPLRRFARDGRDMARHLEEIAENARRQVAAGFDAAGLAVWEALPSELQDTITAANAAGRMWGEISHRIADKALAWSKGEWPIGSARTPTVEPGPGWQQFKLDDSLQNVARANLDLADAVISGDLSAGSDPVANAIYDVFGRDPILPDLARIASGGENAIVAATEAAWHAFETGETARLEEWTDSNSQLTEAVLRARDAAIHTGKMVEGAVNGYLNWAMASDSQGRQGSWQEYFQHYGGEYGTAQGDWLLGQVGLGGILGGKFKDSFANLLIETAQSPFLSAPPILDDDGRVIGTQLKSQEQTQAVPAASAETLTPESVGDTASNVIEVSVSLPEGKSAFTAEEVEQMLGKIDEDVDEIRVKVDRLGKPASVTSGVSMMV